MKLSHLLLVPVCLALAACSSLSIGENNFICKEDPTVCKATTDLLGKHKVLPLKTLDELAEDQENKSSSGIQSAPTLIQANPDGYLKIYLAPIRIQGKVFAPTYLLMPYVPFQTYYRYF